MAAKVKAVALVILAPLLLTSCQPYTVCFTVFIKPVLHGRHTPRPRIFKPIPEASCPRMWHRR